MVNNMEDEACSVSEFREIFSDSINPLHHTRFNPTRRRMILIDGRIMIMIPNPPSQFDWSKVTEESLMASVDYVLEMYPLSDFYNDLIINIGEEN